MIWKEDKKGIYHGVGASMVKSLGSPLNIKLAPHIQGHY